VRLPLLIVVTGMPSSGKTTVAEGLVHRLRLPLIAKDAIKESLYDSLGAADVATSARLGRAAYALIFTLARAFLDSGASLVIEANFFRDQEPEFTALPAHRRSHRARHDSASRSGHPLGQDQQAFSRLDVFGKTEAARQRGVGKKGDLVDFATTQGEHQHAPGLRA
jgi:hypothetical protein